MASTRRIGATTSKTRAALLDATEQVMLEEGYAAVSSRRVAARAELKPQLVHYYFRSMDELFLAVFQRRAEQGLERQAAALDTDNPLQSLWELAQASSDTALTMEFIALANHRKDIGAEIARTAELLRAQQVEVLARHIEERGIDIGPWTPASIVVVLNSIARFLVIEASLGMSDGHDETRSLVADMLGRLG
jgi:AcrR family transcriptional regulator